MFSSGTREPSATLALDKSPSDFANTRAWKSRTSAANSARKLPKQPGGGWPLLAQHIPPARVHTAEPQAKRLRTARKIHGSPRRPEPPASLEAARDCNRISAPAVEARFCFVQKHMHTVKTDPDVNRNNSCLSQKQERWEGKMPRMVSGM